jgi:hypothetical protein
MAQVDTDSAADVAAQLARTLSGVRDPALQVGWIRHQLSVLGAARSADVLTVVLARAEQREERFASLLLRVSVALSAPDLASLRRAIAGLAEVRGQRALARFLGASDEASEDAEDERSDDTDEAPSRKKKERVPDFGKGRPLTLGERKSLARRRDRNLLARVLRDPHPDVIRILLDNPAIVEDDVVRLCALRPVSPEVLVQVFQHTRWIIRYRVRHALSRNPHTPEQVAVQLVPHLTPSDRRELFHASHASERLRAACLAERTSERPLH